MLLLVQVLTQVIVANPDVSLSTLPVAYYGANWNRTQQNIDVLAKFQMVFLMQEDGSCWAQCCPDRFDGPSQCGPLHTATNIPGCNASCAQHGAQAAVFTHVKAAAKAQKRRAPHCVLYMNSVYLWPFDAASADLASNALLDTAGAPHMESCDPGIYPSYFWDFGRAAAQAAWIDIITQHIVHGSADGLYNDCDSTIPIKCDADKTHCIAKRNGRKKSVNENVTHAQYAAYVAGKNTTMLRAARLVESINGTFYNKNSPENIAPTFGGGNLHFLGKLDRLPPPATFIGQVRAAQVHYPYLVIGGANAYSNPLRESLIHGQNLSDGRSLHRCSETVVSLFLLALEPGLYLLCNGWDDRFDRPLGLPTSNATLDPITTVWRRAFAHGVVAHFNETSREGRVYWPPGKREPPRRAANAHAAASRGSRGAPAHTVAQRGARAAAAGAANASTRIEPSATYGEWEGWGTSLCWWANVFGASEHAADIADALFSTKERTAVGGYAVPGLGLTIARYNAGGSSRSPDQRGEKEALSPNMRAGGEIMGFWLDWASEDPGSSSWDWSVDTAQRAMLALARERAGAAFIAELFSNSPMWWMLKNHDPSGSPSGASDNLQSWNYASHATYLATVASHAATAWNVTFASVEAFNEPSAAWWKAQGTQEGCHFDVRTQAAVIPLLRAALDARNLTATRVSASDENSYDVALSTWEGLGEAAQRAVGQINVHGYQQGGGRRDLLFAAAAAAKVVLRNSEYGEGDVSGLSLASNLILDFKSLHPTAWVYWQALDGGTWGLIEGDDTAATIGAVNPKFYVLAQYSRHIRPGDTIISGGRCVLLFFVTFHANLAHSLTRSLTSLTMTTRSAATRRRSRRSRRAAAARSSWSRPTPRRSRAGCASI